MKVLVATHNQSKLKRYKKILKAVDNVELVSLIDLGITEKVEESYSTNTENALHKAMIYGKLSGLITIAVDEALTANFLPDNEQPGVYARRFSPDKKELTDKEVTDVWKDILKLYPQPGKQFVWSFAIACCNPNNDTESFIECVQQISYVARYFSDIIPNGYPMSSFMSPYKNGKPYSELSQEQVEGYDAKNFEGFAESFSVWLGKQS
jgi:inosine/xanthosine triphosphate pyrophosphatase family protein